MNFEELDFYLCSKTWKKITKRYGKYATALDYTEEERVVVLVWYVTGIIENGGFHYLFESKLPGDSDYKFTLDAFKQIGCLKAESAIHDALCLFPNCRPPLDDKERIKLYELNPEEILIQINSLFWDEMDEITKALANYIRKNKILADLK